MAKSTRNTTPASTSPSRKSNAGKKTDAKTDAAKSSLSGPAAPSAAPLTSAPVEVTAKTESVTPARPVQSALAFPAFPAEPLAEVSAREVVFTIDGWKSLHVLRSSEAPSAFQQDRVLLTGVAPGTEVEFAVHLRFDSQHIWLNNGGRNFRQITG